MAGSRNRMGRSSEVQHAQSSRGLGVLPLAAFAPGMGNMKMKTTDKHQSPATSRERRKRCNLPLCPSAPGINNSGGCSQPLPGNEKLEHHRRSTCAESAARASACNPVLLFPAARQQSDLKAEESLVNQGCLQNKASSSFPTATQLGGSPAPRGRLLPSPRGTVQHDGRGSACWEQKGWEPRHAETSLGDTAGIQQQRKRRPQLLLAQHRARPLCSGAPLLSEHSARSRVSLSAPANLLWVAVPPSTAQHSQQTQAQGLIYLEKVTAATGVLSEQVR